LTGQMHRVQATNNNFQLIQQAYDKPFEKSRNNGQSYERL